MKISQFSRKDLFLVPLAALFCMMWMGCDGPEDPYIVDDGVNGLFWPEYDYQEGYDIFHYGDVYASNVFLTCSTSFSPDTDNQDILTAEVVDYDSLYGYAYKHFTQDAEGVSSKCYIVGIENASNKPDSNALGVTSQGGVEGEAVVFIFVQEIHDQFDNGSGSSGFQKVLEGTVIHELGHARADLDELCLPDGTIDGSHNSNSCIMGQVPYASCTNQNTTANPHFCDNDKAKIRSIQW